MYDTVDFLVSFCSSVPCGTLYCTFGVTVRMWVTIIKKNRTENIKSGSDAVFRPGTSLLWSPNIPITAALLLSHPVQSRICAVDNTCVWHPAAEMCIG